MVYLPYAGIGSRQTPREICDLMTRIARRLAARGFTLRSGGADGADLAFEAGAGDSKEIFLPWKGFNGSDSPLHKQYSKYDQAMVLASSLHPAWHSLGNGPRSMMARNCCQVLGENLDSPSKFIVCWTPDGCESIHERSRRTGGTGQAIALAFREDIPVFNLKRPDAMERLAEEVFRLAA